MIKQIEEQIASTIAKETGATVEITITAAHEFTISGSTDDTQRAAHYLYTHNLASVENSVFDEDCGNFIYMVTK